MSVSRQPAASQRPGTDGIVNWWRIITAEYASSIAITSGRAGARSLARFCTASETHINAFLRGRCAWKKGAPLRRTLSMFLGIRQVAPEAIPGSPPQAGTKWNILNWMPSRRDRRERKLRRDSNGTAAVDRWTEVINCTVKRQVAHCAHVALYLEQARRFMSGTLGAFTTCSWITD